MHFIFEVDNDLKYEYLNSKPTNTAQTEMFVLRSADEYEKLINKEIYNMTYLELREMLAMQYKNSSIAVIIKNISILRGYIEFCINKKVVAHGENRMEVFTIDEAESLVHQQAIENKFITREKLREYQSILYNEQDKLLIELPFIGVRGRTVKGGTFEEIINLTMPNMSDEENNMLTLTQNNGKHRMFKVETSTMALVRSVYEQEVYVENNGEPTNNIRIPYPKEFKINKLGNYIFRIPGKNKLTKFATSTFYSRLRNFKIWLNNPYISYTSLYHAGMTQAAMDIYKENGVVTAEDFKNICIRYNYGAGHLDRYWFSVKDLFEQYKEFVVNHPRLKSEDKES